MCRIALVGAAILEVFPSVDSDDVAQITLVAVDEGEEFTIEAVDLHEDSVVFTLADLTSSSLPREAIEIVEDCGWCELSRNGNSRSPR